MQWPCIKLLVTHHYTSLHALDKFLLVQQSLYDILDSSFPPFPPSVLFNVKSSTYIFGLPLPVEQRCPILLHYIFPGMGVWSRLIINSAGHWPSRSRIRLICYIVSKEFKTALRSVKIQKSVGHRYIKICF